jgi:histidine triad (HIT) family protein
VETENTWSERVSKPDRRSMETTGTTNAHTTAQASCPFCLIIAGQAEATFIRRWPDAIAIRPRGGVNATHVLVIPRVHTSNAGEEPEIAAIGMRRAAELMAEYPAANIITSKGRAATQSIEHCHIHVVGREDGDDLPLPWTPQQQARREGRA